eukprot:gene17347-12356_t
MAFDRVHHLTETRPRGQRFAPPPRKKMEQRGPGGEGTLKGTLKGTRMGMLLAEGTDLTYNIDYSSQENKAKGAVRIGRTAIVSPDKSYPFRRAPSSAPRPEGVLGDAHRPPAERHQNRVGFIGKDPRQDVWNRQHGPLNVKWTAVEPRAGRFAAFSRQSSRSPDGPFSGTLSTSACFSDADEMENELSETER